jgi:PhnB protein
MNSSNLALRPYLSFDGRCEEALGFYQRTLGAKIELLVRFEENPEAGHNPPGAENKVMHAALRIGTSRILVSDGQCTGKPTFAGFSLSLNATSADEVDRLTAALADGGGQVQLPPAKTFFSPRFAMATDRFGVSWMILVHP